VEFWSYSDQNSTLVFLTGESSPPAASPAEQAAAGARAIRFMSPKDFTDPPKISTEAELER
jgi:hypothetical protein